MPSGHDWDPHSPAVWQEIVHGEDRAITLRHPTYPLVETSTGDWADLNRIAAGYLEKVRSAFGLPPLFRESAGPSFAVGLSWLKLDESVPARPRASFSVGRYRTPPPHPVLIDRTVVFLAVQSLQPNDEKTAIGSRLGIRIVAHLSRRQGEQWEVRITGSSCSAGLARALGERSPRISTFFNQFFSPEGFAELRVMVRSAARLADDAPVGIDGFRIVPSPAGEADLEMYANVPRPEYQPEAVPYAMTFRVLFPSNVLPLQLVPIEKRLLVAHLATVTARLFRQDPASQAGAGHLVDARPNRAPDRLEQYRTPTPLPGLTPDPSGDTPLIDPPLDQVQVLQSRLVDGSANETQTQVVNPAAIPHARTSVFAAASGYQHARELFDTMRGYGLWPSAFLKFASWPLRVRYRAPIRPGPGKDGKTVNAQVDYDPPGGNLILDDWGPSVLKPLQVRFALADLKRSSSRREPLGLTADPRWSWHEYSHVLLAASTGALELRFTHSVGDALAAIICDPASTLATPSTPATPLRPAAHPRTRALTFPWVYINRRHDRSVFHGWSWCGRYHRPLRFSSGGTHGPRKAYQSEQILSTSLFRLYQALGGDTSTDAIGTPDVGARTRTADYTAYLILRAIGLLGPATWVPPETPDQLVSALVDADVATMPAALGPLQDRTGGWAHKVIRWAFEAQGLYATTDPLAVMDEPGKPPPTDVFIDDRRPNSEGARPRGGYMPVSLDWGASVDPPLWHATPQAVEVTGSRVHVQVRNRGDLDAAGVSVRVWHAKWPNTDPDPPAWNTAAWTSLGPRPAKTVPAWPAPAVTFGPFTGLPAPPAGHRLLVVAVATCVADPANADGATLLPCSTEPTPLVDLVAGDNNIGLIVAP
jgi:hypothetical protein